MQVRRLAILSVVAGACLSVSTVTSATPDVLTYTGSLLAENGLPYTGTVAVTARLYGDMSGGAAMWTQDLGEQVVAGGLLSADLMGGQMLWNLLASDDSLWLEFDVDGETLSPRQRLTSVPYAAVAGNADKLGGMDAASFVSVQNGVPTDSLATNSISQTSNGAISNEFTNVSWSWTGSANIIDYPAAAAQATVTTSETGSTYLTSLVIYTEFTLGNSSTLDVVLHPPTGTGVGPIQLFDNQVFGFGAHAHSWTAATLPELAAILGTEVQGTWKLEISDLDDNSPDGTVVGSIVTFDVVYDVVRSDHVAVAGTLDVEGQLNAATAHVNGDLTVGGELRRKMQYHTYTGGQNFTTDAYVEVPGRRFTFTKHEASTKLLVHWTDNLRCTGGTSWSGCQWRIRIDDADCTAPHPLSFTGYMGPTSVNSHFPMTNRVVCEQIGGSAISAGNHSISIWVRTFNGANSWTGWGVGYGAAGEDLNAGLITVEEIY